MAKQKYTLLLDKEIAEKVRQSTGNLSETVTNLLKQMVAESEAKKILESLKEYDQHSTERRTKYGIFSNSSRKFL